MANLVQTQKTYLIDIKLVSCNKSFWQKIYMPLIHIIHKGYKANQHPMPSYCVTVHGTW